MKFKFLLLAVYSLTTLSIAQSAQNLSELVMLLDSKWDESAREARNGVSNYLPAQLRRRQM